MFRFSKGINTHTHARAHTHQHAHMDAHTRALTHTHAHTHARAHTSTQKEIIYLWIIILLVHSYCIFILSY